MEEFNNHPVQNAPQNTKNFEFRYLIESLKLGIAPSELIKSFTFGKDRELEHANEFFESDLTNVCSLLGKYGEGKTHLLNYIMKEVLDQKWIVTKIEINNSSCNFSKPITIFREIIRNIKYLENRRPKEFQDFFIELIKDNIYVSNKWYLSSTIQTFHRSITSTDNYDLKIELDELWEYLLCKINIPKSKIYPTLYKHGNCANIYCNIFYGLSAAAVELGYQGFLILIDEGENITRIKKKYSRNLLEGLYKTANQMSYLFTEEINKDTSDGVESELFYCKTNPYRFCFECEPAAQLRVMIALPKAFTEFGDDVKIQEIEVYNIEDDDKKKMIKNLIERYNEYYGNIFTIRPEMINAVFSRCNDTKVRFFLKKIICYLEAIRLKKMPD